jgi:hypothetical protein
MRKLIYGLIASLWMGSVFAALAQPPVGSKAATSTKNAAPDSQQLEYDLQRLPWTKFRSVIESVPKMKADVEAYGPVGWKYVEANYSTYAWKKKIDKLDDAQKRQLAELIRRAKSAK